VDEPHTSDKRKAPEQGQPATPGPVTVAPPLGLLSTGTESRRDGKSSGDDSGKSCLGEDPKTKELFPLLPVVSQTGTVIVSAPTPANQPPTPLASGLEIAQCGKEPEGSRQDSSVGAIASTTSKSGKGSKWRRLSVFGLGQSGAKGAILGDPSLAGESSRTAERREASRSWRLKVSKTGTILGRSKPVLLAKKSTQYLVDFFKRDSGQTVAEGGSPIKPREE